MQAYLDPYLFDQSDFSLVISYKDSKIVKYREVDKHESCERPIVCEHCYDQAVFVQPLRSKSKAGTGDEKYEYSAINLANYNGNCLAVYGAV